jgi:predicted O-linked N-acetylglucosamine transferase (SPINDLY family)
MRLIDQGNVSEDAGRSEEALERYDTALRLSPTSARAHLNRGNALLALGRTDEALASYASTIALNPEYAAAHYNLGNAYLRSGQPDAAIGAYRKALALKADFVDAEIALGCALEDTGQPIEAAASYRRALELDPEYAEASRNLGNVLRGLGRAEDAVASYRRALEIKPDFAEAHTSLGDVLNSLGRLDEAIASHRRALAIDPAFADAHSNLGNSLKDQGRLDDAVASYRRALEIRPDFDGAYTGLFFSLSHNQETGPDALFAEHCRFGAQFEAPLRASWPQHRNERDPDRSLRIGFVSADLRSHPIAYFIEPLLRHLAECPALSLHAYYNHAVEDHITARLRHHFKHWTPVVTLSDEALAKKIEDDGIDILIDLSGHTSGNRLLTFARKPAPVQASWMGYPGTTGLSAMDYYFADRHFLPLNEFSGQFAEKLVHLPASAPFLPDERAPPVNALPALTNGHVTFGSFNRLSKLRPAAIALWSQLLRALPDARMVLAGMPENGAYGSLVEWFAQEGIVRERLDFHPRCDTAEYLRLHHRVDICLDTFPYTGGTTTAHALWMGVPTLTLAGRTAPGRQGAAILGQVGLDAFVAGDEADFLRKGQSWGADLDALAGVRAGLRERCRQSSLQWPEVIAAGLERALRTMWERWCAELPPVAFAVGPP